MVFHAAESTRRFLSPTFSVLFILRGVAVAEVVKTRQTELRTRRQSAVGLLTIWPTISADLALTLFFLFFFFFFFTRAASNCFSHSHKREWQIEIELYWTLRADAGHNRYGRPDPNK